MGEHIIDGKFQSDKYPTTPPGLVPLSVRDPAAQPLLWEYAQRRRVVDAAFSADLETALLAAGYKPPPRVLGMAVSNVLARYFSTLLETLGDVVDAGTAAEARRGYAMADMAVRVAVDYAGRHLSDSDAAALAVLKEVVDEDTATAANRALLNCYTYPNHEVLVFAACATAQATSIAPSYARACAEVAFYTARTVQKAGAKGRRIAEELVAQIR